jgi:hypothetical protein
MGLAMTPKMTPKEQIRFHLEQLFTAIPEREREYHRDCISWLEQQLAAQPPNIRGKWHTEEKRRMWRLIAVWF